MRIIDNLKGFFGGRFLVLYLILTFTCLFISLLIDSKLFDWVYSIILLIILLIRIASRGSIESGWKLLAVKYATRSNGFGALPNKPIHISALINGFNYPLYIQYSKYGLFLKVNIVLRYKHKNIFLPWSSIAVIIVRSALHDERNLSFWQKINLSGSDDKFAEIKLKEFPNIFIELPWSEEFKNSVPQNVKIDVRD